MHKFIAVVSFLLAFFFTFTSKAEYVYDIYGLSNSYLQNNAKTGLGLAMNDEWLFVGIPGFDKPAYYMPPWISFPAFTDAGAVDVYRKNESGEWDYFERILPLATVGSYAYFGSSIDISGNKVIIGAPGANSNRGFASVYIFNGVTWSLSYTFNPGTQNEGDKFGFSVAIDGNCIAIGSPGKDKIDYSTLPDETLYADFGGVYNYYHNGSSYINLGVVTFSNFARGDGQLGYSVDVNDALIEYEHGCRVAAGAPYAKSTANETQYGALLVYKKRTDASYYEEGTYTGETENSELGYSVSMSCVKFAYYNTSQFQWYIYSNCVLLSGAPGMPIVSLDQGGVYSFAITPLAPALPARHHLSFTDTIAPVDLPAGARLGESISLNWVGPSLYPYKAIVGAPNYNGNGAVFIYDTPNVVGQIFPSNILLSPNPQSNSKFGLAVTSDQENMTITGCASSPYWDAMSLYNIGKAYMIEEI
ncbi:MAG: hypothetical protein CVU59_00890 [Deltaproteobacteria bacterium HGW-Deltaproteobacteria-17]|nr:MAG: hypothetical protein CVU59_00890 [Deltaproteobacteria bacterium HGW-Deltaproteobacteria-17]